MQARDLASSFGLLVLRVGTGGYLLTHGLGKLDMLLEGKFDAIGDPIGVGPEISLVLVTVAEFLCPLLVILGLGTRFAAVPPVIAMAVAAFVAHANDPWTTAEAWNLYMAKQRETFASKQPALMFLVPFLTLVFTGGGRFAVDAWIGRKRAAKRG